MNKADRARRITNSCNSFNFYMLFYLQAFFLRLLSNNNTRQAAVLTNLNVWIKKILFMVTCYFTVPLSPLRSN